MPHKILKNIMRKNLLLLVAFCTINLSFGQYYISSSIGQAIGSAEVQFGEIITATESESSYGSYGEGTNFQIRAGYFFNDTFGLDFGFAYLHGADQTVRIIDIPNESAPNLSVDVNAKARGRAFGFTPSVVYKFTNKFYGRFGALIKLGGKTEAIVHSSAPLTAEQREGTGLPAGSYSNINYIEDYHGQLPLGFVGAFGYKHNIGNNLDLFVEAEYMGVSVKRKDSEIVELSGGLFLPDGTEVAAFDLDNVPSSLVIETTYVDKFSNVNTVPSIKLAERVPYSSFGINFGITYVFSKKQ